MNLPLIRQQRLLYRHARYADPSFRVGGALHFPTAGTSSRYFRRRATLSFAKSGFGMNSIFCSHSRSARIESRIRQIVVSDHPNSTASRATPAPSRNLALIPNHSCVKASITRSVTSDAGPASIAGDDVPTMGVDPECFLKLSKSRKQPSYPPACSVEPVRHPSTRPSK